jgi:arylsulfatase A-like enzyme
MTPRPPHASRSTTPPYDEGAPVNPIANVPGQPQNPEPGQDLPPIEGAPGHDLPDWNEEPDHELPDIPEGEIDNSLPGEGLTKWQIAAALVHAKRVLQRQSERRRARRENRQERREDRQQARKGPPNILVIMGDDIGIHNVSAYNHGIQNFYTPNIDRIGHEGVICLDAYGQNSCTAGRSAFLSGMTPFRTGLCKVGQPGSPLGYPDWAPTVAELLKDHDYRTGQFGKNHLGDLNSHLPTLHGFDEFFGSLYHLNAQEEPETEFYPKDPEFLAKYGPRGVLHCKAGKDRPKLLPGQRVQDDPRFGPVGDQTIVDTGPLNRARMPDHDMKEILPNAVQFITDAAKADERFFCWVNPSRTHIWSYLREGLEGRTGAGRGADALSECDDLVGVLLKLLDDLKIADNTIVVFTTDNGAEAMTWPDGGVTPFHGEKGTTWEGGFRIPLLMRWPGVIEPLTVSKEIISLEDFLPTFLSAAGDPDIKEKLKKGYKAKNGKQYKVWLDGFDFVPYLSGAVEKGPREEFFYFSGQGELNAVRWTDWKVTFASIQGNLVNGLRNVTAYPIVTHLRGDPYEVMHMESEMYFRWYVDNAWIFIPVGEMVEAFMASLMDDEYPKQAGSSIGPQDLNYTTLQIASTMQQLSNRGPTRGRALAARPIE